ncbi:uncharacterized protein MYCFIDRAFT_169449 [Pseudocercospora fijiensis CIRAD86]|uniref:Uncharacterized protein n=1 Tax=Pseudocercospora fijiensis (strain CIRAD86) TaxID=383855 RepID=N1Q7N6_PSEFD|nr:uncharacterized protein MYCFIDRAFT_169449 [Pseudocercospora fijiensis CIRAD86]EME87666.1 hypothetical protein MYCFIDRAFT_169449 [Pseudocercospora fijiensis CIRAD86]
MIAYVHLIVFGMFAWQGSGGLAALHVAYVRAVIYNPHAQVHHFQAFRWTCWRSALRSSTGPCYKFYRMSKKLRPLADNRNSGQGYRPRLRGSCKPALLMRGGGPPFHLMTVHWILKKGFIFREVPKGHWQVLGSHIKGREASRHNALNNCRRSLRRSSKGRLSRTCTLQYKSSAVLGRMTLLELWYQRLYVLYTCTAAATAARLTASLASALGPLPRYLGCITYCSISEPQRHTRQDNGTLESIAKRASCGIEMRWWRSLNE